MMIDAAGQYIAAFFITQIAILPFLIPVLSWCGRVSRFKLQNRILNVLIVWGFVFPLFFLADFPDISSFSADLNSADIKTVESGRLLPGRSVVELPPELPEGFEYFSAYSDPSINILNSPDLQFSAGWGMIEKYYRKLSAISPFFLVLMIPGIFLFLRTVLVNFRYLSGIRQKSRIKNQVDPDTGYRVYRSDMVPFPFSAGFVSPAVYLPSDLPVLEEPVILRHERAHIRLGHVSWRWVYEIYASLFWFYPVSRIIRKISIRLQELAADEEVLMHEDRSIYLEILMKWADFFAARKERISLTVNSVSGSSFSIRIKEILTSGTGKTSGLNRFVIISGMLSAILLSIGFLSCSPGSVSGTDGYSSDTGAGEYFEDVTAAFQSADLPGAENSLENYLKELEIIEEFGVSRVELTGILGFPEYSSNNSIPSSWPLSEGIGRITLPFGNAEPISGLRAEPWFHTGIDIAAQTGTAVLATGTGSVFQTGFEPETFGRYIVIRHDFGFSSIYTHLKEIGVEKGQQIESGEPIGKLGNTGKSTGPHLHFAVSISPVSISPGEGISGAVYADPLILMDQEEIIKQ